MSRRLARGFALAFSLVAAAAAAEDRALLVGIDVYQDPRIPSTPGATLDAKGMADLAQKSFGFPQGSVRLLLDRQATAQEIVQQFESWLIEGTQPGDRVFFLYAGHGSQLKDDNGDEEDGWDETLAPFDVDPLSGERQIRDDVLDGLIARLSGRRAVLVFDSCHSGTVTRGMPKLSQFPQGGGARYLPRAEDLQKIWAPDGEYATRAGSYSYTLEATGRGAAKSVLDDPAKAGNLSGIIAISAAQPGQLAYPVEVDGKFRGALSYLLQEVYGGTGSRALFDDIRNRIVSSVGNTAKGAAVDATLGKLNATGTLEDAQKGVTVGVLETTINAGMKRLQQTGRLPGDQEPWFEVISQYPLREEPLFGGWEQAAQVALSNPVSNLKVGLRTTDGRTTFTQGQRLSFEVSTDRAGYLYLLVFSEGNVATCIYPNPNDSNNRIAAGTKRLPASSRYVFPVQEPFGRDVVIALVSEERKRLCEKVNYTWDEVFEWVDLRAVHEDLRQRSKRGVGVLPMAAQPSGSSGQPDRVESWQVATLELLTGPGGEN